MGIHMEVQAENPHTLSSTRPRWKGDEVMDLRVEGACGSIRDAPPYANSAEQGLE